MDEQEALRWLAALTARGIQPGLSRILAMLSRLGDPQKRLRVVHVAGTNGKGSTAAMIQSMATATGWKTALFSSPAITGVRDTITIDGRPIPPDTFAALATELAEQMDAGAAATALTEFECLTALAITWFSRERVDLAVIECGLGGKEDATHVFPAPLCAVFTPISLDHTRLLGSTVEEIARQKAGIIHAPGAVVSSSRQQPEALAVLMEEAALQGLTLRMSATGQAELLPGGTWAVIRGSSRYPLALCGRFQVDNAQTALEVADVLQERGWPIGEEARHAGLAAVHMPCRQELLPGQTPLMLDGAHNPHGVAALADTITQRWPGQPVTLLTGMLRDKDVAACAHLLAPLASTVVCCTPPHPTRALPANQLATCYPGAQVVEPWDQALTTTLALARSSGQPLVIAGSFYLAGAVRELLLK